MAENQAITVHSIALNNYQLTKKIRVDVYQSFHIS